MSSLAGLCNPVAIQEDALFLLKNNDTSDLSINNNNHTSFNTTTTTGIYDESDGAFTFSNSSFLVSNIFNTTYGNFKTSPYTICFWIYPTTKSYTNSNMNIVSSWNGSYYSGVWIAYDTGNNDLVLHYYSGSYNSLTLNKSISFNSWHFIHFSMGDGYRRIGLDQDYIESSNITPDMSNIIGNCGIGPNCGPVPTNPGFHYNGKIMGVYLFPKILNLGELEIIRLQKGQII
jgi:hypothetical protein